jgi:hypothetical protein
LPETFVELLEFFGGGLSSLDLLVTGMIAYNEQSIADGEDPTMTIVL